MKLGQLQKVKQLRGLRCQTDPSRDSGCAHVHSRWRTVQTICFFFTKYDEKYLEETMIVSPLPLHMEVKKLCSPSLGYLCLISAL